MTTVDITSALFADLPADLVARVRDRCTVLSVRPADCIMPAGSRDQTIFLVLSGEVVLKSAASETQHEATADLHPGDFFGELTLLGFTEQPMSAVACTSCDVLVLDTTALDELLRAAPVEFMRNLSRFSIQRLRSTTRENLRGVQLVLGSLVHDLKNPISAAMMATEMIAEEPTRDLKDRLALVDRSMTRVLLLVQDVLDAIRGKTNIHRAEFRIEELMLELEELVLVRVRTRGINVVTRLEFTGTIIADSRAVARALVNIIKNAGEAMNRSGTLTLATRVSDDHVIFRVSDTGPGIHPKVLAGLFDRLVSYGKDGGSGFGMTITKTIAEAHGGAVHLVKTSEKGTTFEIVLPLR